MQDIRAFDIVRTPKSFDARERCTARRYEYIMPTFVLAPKDDVAAMFAEVSAQFFTYLSKCLPIAVVAYLI